MAKTEREQRMLWSPPPPSYGEMVTINNLLFASRAIRQQVNYSVSRFYVYITNRIKTKDYEFILVWSTSQDAKALCPLSLWELVIDNCQLANDNRK